MNRINTEATRINDYYPAGGGQEVDATQPADQAGENREGQRLYQQMQEGMQDFNLFINATDATLGQERLGKSIAGAETVKQGLIQYSRQPTADMSSLMLEMNKLLSKMRDLQRDHALQQQQQALKMQEKAYSVEKDSIAKSQAAALTGAIFGGLGAGAGLLGGVAKTKGALGKVSAETKKAHVDKLMRDPEFRKGLLEEGGGSVLSDNKLEEAAFSKINDQSKWSRLKPENWGKSSTSIQQLDKKITSNTRWEGGGEFASGLAPMGDVAGKAAALKDTAASQRLKVGADRDKGLQHLNEREQGIRDDQAREASKQLRDVQSQMNDLYGKIASAVRW